jgi:peptide/nickel transport system ATP-binding protein
MPSLLSVRDLKTHFATSDGIVRAVDGVSFDVAEGETLGIVGESGCGKSVTALSVMQLLPKTSATMINGAVLFEGRDLLQLDERTLRGIRGNRLAMIFQEPMTALNPLLRVGDQIAEALRIHTGADRREARASAIAMLRLVRIPAAEVRYNDYPHQFSGGMRQRVMIAMALACSPKLLIADEPTTALDVTIQAQILRLLIDLKARAGAAVVLITHDLGVVAETCQRVMVMYAGKKIEEALVERLFERPAHPYTRGLIAAKPGAGAYTPGQRLAEIPGLVPSLTEPITGCAFAPRCPIAKDRCRKDSPLFAEIAPHHGVACFAAERQSQ